MGIEELVKLREGLEVAAPSVRLLDVSLEADEVSVRATEDVEL